VKNKKIVITYGTYDMLHEGHINLLKRAKELGDYLIVGVTSESYDRSRGKLNVSQSTKKRVNAIKKLPYVDEVIIETHKNQKLEDVQKYNVDIFAIGDDWVGKFDYLKKYTEVIYLPRTEGISSTLIRKNSIKPIKLGIVGTGRIAERFKKEAEHVCVVITEWRGILIRAPIPLVAAYCRPEKHHMVLTRSNVRLLLQVS